MKTLRQKINRIPAILLIAVICFCATFLTAQGTGAWTAATAGSTDLGSTTTWFQDIYFGHTTTASRSAKLLITPTAARTITFPDNSFTLNTDNVIDATAATPLTAAQSGSLVLFDSSTGFAVTLPAPAVGLKYDFLVKTSANASKIITNTTTTDFLVGAPNLIIDNSTAKAFACNGTSHVALTMNGTTTGGIAGTWLEVRGISSTLWEVHGNVVGSGTLATPCATS